MGMFTCGEDKVETRASKRPLTLDEGYFTACWTIFVYASFDNVYVDDVIARTL